MYKFTLILLITLLGLGLLAITLKALPGNITSSSPSVQAPYGGTAPFELSGSRSPFATLLSLYETRKFNLSENLANFASSDTGYYNGKFFSFFPPGVAIIGLPFYILGTHFNLSQAFAFYSVSILAVLCLILLFRICDEIFSFPKWVSLFVVILTGFASHFFNYAVTFYAQVPATFFILFAFYSAWRYKQQTKFSWIWACIVWGCYGLASFIDYPNLVLMLPVMIYFFVSAININRSSNGLKVGIKMTFVATAIVLIGLGGLHMYYNYKNFGSWKRLSNTLAQYDPTQAGSTLANLQAEDVAAISNSKQQVSSVFRERQLPKGVYELLFSTNKSMLMDDPFYLISIIGILFIIRKKLTIEVATLLAFVLINIFLYGSFGDPWGGWSFGPRYLVPSVPIFAIFFGYWLSLKRGMIFKKLIALAFFVYGAAVSLLGVLGTSIIEPDAETVKGFARNYLGTIQFLKSGQYGSLFFNTFLRSKISLVDYYLILLAFLTLLAFMTLFILPLFEKTKPTPDVATIK